MLLKLVTTLTLLTLNLLALSLNSDDVFYKKVDKRKRKLS